MKFLPPQGEGEDGGGLNKPPNKNINKIKYL